MPLPEGQHLPLWGGLECSVVRIGDQYRDELAETGHRDRPDDLDRIASLGISTLRYPVLWEHVAPDDPEICDWTFYDERLTRLRSLHIEPIVGLVHHGSGPRYTSLLDPLFAEKLARHARRVAERYPWLRLFTPVNEPLTTARFSGLYGHWFPHRQDENSFLQMVVNQCQAVARSMAAIREVIPEAQLIQTEDVGKVFSTPQLAPQAGYENERRWLSLDLLNGRVDVGHLFWSRCLASGSSEADLTTLNERPTPPDILGINHYLTSERYLDENWWNYPDDLSGGNRRQRYADAEAVRIPHLSELTGPEPRLREVWDRYHRPIAVTEVHHGCWGEEQVRWLLEVWDAAECLRHEGADIRAVTIWSLFGSVDWNSLLTNEAGFYEPGAFDMRVSPPAETFLAEAARDLARNGWHPGSHAVSTGWWRSQNRFYPPQQTRQQA